MKKENKKEELTLENCPEILDGEQVAKIFHISSRTVFELAMSGQIDSFKIGRCRNTPNGLFIATSMSSRETRPITSTGRKKTNP